MKAKKLLLTVIVALSSMYGTSVFAQSETINLGVDDAIATVLTNYAGTNTDISVVIPAGYNNPEYLVSNVALNLTGIPATITNLTIEGDGSSPTLMLKNIDLPASSLTSFKIKNLTLKGHDEGVALANYLIASTSVAIPTVTVEGCTLANFRGIMRLKTGTNFSDVTIDNCIIRNTGSYCLLVTEAGSTLGNYTIKNSTVYGTNTTVFGVGASAPTTFTISDCTFDNIIYAAGKYFIDFGAATPTLTITNTILGKTAYASGTVKGIRGGTGFTYTVTNSFTTSDFLVASPGVTGFTAYENTAANLFKTPTVFDGAAATASVGDYTIKDGTFAGATTAGAPRWYYQVPTSSISPKVDCITIYPNPTSDIVYFNKNFAQIEVVNIVGCVVKSAKNINQCSLVGLQKGTYIIRATDDAGSISVQKITKK